MTAVSTHKSHWMLSLPLGMVICFIKTVVKMKELEKKKTQWLMERLYKSASLPQKHLS